MTNENTPQKMELKGYGRTVTTVDQVHGASSPDLAVVYVHCDTLDGCSQCQELKQHWQVNPETLRDHPRWAMFIHSEYDTDENRRIVLNGELMPLDSAALI